MATSFSNFISSEQHHHKVCGMHPSLLAALRGCKEASDFDQLCSMVIARTEELIASLGSPKVPKVGVFVTAVIGKPLHVPASFDADADILITLIPDPVWIDCKQATILKVGSPFDDERVEATLYKLSVNHSADSADSADSASKEAGVCRSCSALNEEQGGGQMTGSLR
jgi:hypothetical protein